MFNIWHYTLYLEGNLSGTTQQYSTAQYGHHLVYGCMSLIPPAEGSNTSKNQMKQGAESLLQAFNPPLYICCELNLKPKPGESTSWTNVSLKMQLFLYWSLHQHICIPHEKLNLYCKSCNSYLYFLFLRCTIQWIK